MSRNKDQREHAELKKKTRRNWSGVAGWALGEGRCQGQVLEAMKRENP